MVCEMVLLIVIALLFPGLSILRGVDGALTYDCCLQRSVDGSSTSLDFMDNLPRGVNYMCPFGGTVTLTASGGGSNDHITSCSCSVSHNPCVRTHSPTSPLLTFENAEKQIAYRDATIADQAAEIEHVNYLYEQLVYSARSASQGWIGVICSICLNVIFAGVIIWQCYVMRKQRQQKQGQVTAASSKKLSF